jgi:hypothetical protein
MTFRLTFNKPAVRQFIEGDEKNTHLKIKIDGGIVMFMPSGASDADTAKLMSRTRGGYEAVIEGSESDEVLRLLTNPTGPFFVLHRHSKDWVAASPYTGGGAPPKFEPHVRVWAETTPKAVAPTKKKTVARVTKERAQVATFDNPMDRIRWAYEKLNEQRRPGRPSNEFQSAKQIVGDFEAEAMSFVLKFGKPGFDATNLNRIIEAHDSIVEFLQVTAPEVLQRPSRHAALHVRPEMTDDELAEEQVADAERKLGLGEKPVEMSRKVRGKIHPEMFNGGCLMPESATT